MVAKCPADNKSVKEQEDFWNGDFDYHKIGWIISGGAAALTIIISFITIFGHARNYNRPLEQKQIIRILFFAPVFASISFLSYRFFRSYTYYELAEVAYEAFAIAAFLMLLLQYVGDNVEEQIDVFAKKEKRKLPLPFCCWRYRPSKAYFLNLLKWGVIQYIIVRPALSIAGIILEYYELLCVSSYSYKYGEVYLVAIDFVSISIALYALIVLYGLLKEDLKGRRPLAKFMTIKLAIFFTFYQSFVFGVLQDHGVIKGSEFWSSTNVTDGLDALCTSCEMVIVAAFQMWAFPWNEYYVSRLKETNQKIMPIKANKKGKTSIWRSMFNVLNFSDFFLELWHSVRFGFDRLRGKEYTRTDLRFGKFDFPAAFGAEGQGNASIRGDQSPLARSESRFEMEEHAAAKGKNGGEDDGAKFDPNSSSGFSPTSGNNRNNLNNHNNGNGFLHPNSPRSDYTNRSSFNDSDTLGSLNSSSIGIGASGFQARRRPSFDPHPLSKSTITEDGDYNVRSDIGLSNQNQNQSQHSIPRSNNNPNVGPNGLNANHDLPLNLVNLPGKAELGRLSPSPRSPRDSSGRYPGFLYDSNQLRDNSGMDSFNRPRSTSPNPNGNGNGREREIIRQPSPNQPGSWNNTPYRVSGFPRDSYIETDHNNSYGHLNQSQNPNSNFSQKGNGNGFANGPPPQRVHPNALYPNQYQISNDYVPQQRLYNPQSSDSRSQLQQLSQPSDPHPQSLHPQQQSLQTNRPNDIQPRDLHTLQPAAEISSSTAPLSIPNKLNKSNPSVNTSSDLPPSLVAGGNQSFNPSLHPQPQSQHPIETNTSEVPIHIPPPSSTSRGERNSFINQTGFRDSLFVPNVANHENHRPNSLVGSENGELSSSAGHGNKSRPGSWEPQAL